MNFEYYTPEEYDRILKFAIDQSGFFKVFEHYDDIKKLIMAGRSEDDIEIMYADVSNFDEKILSHFGGVEDGGQIYTIGSFANLFLLKGGFRDLYQKRKIEEERVNTERQAQHNANLATISAAQAAEVSIKWAKVSGIVAVLAVLAALGAWLFPRNSDDKIKALQDTTQRHQIYFDSFNKTVTDLRDSLIKLRDLRFDTTPMIKPLK